MIFILYPSVTALIEAQRLIDRYGAVSSDALKARDSLILQIIGFVFLYIVLAFGLKFIEIELQETTIRPHEDKPVEQKQIIETKPHKPPKLLSNIAKNGIVALSATTFLIVYAWQAFSGITQNGDPMFLVSSAMVAFVACLIVGVTAYLIAKYS